MERKRVLLWVFLIAVALILAGAVGLTLAQGPDGDDDVLPQGDVSVATPLDDVIPIQGRLLDAHGNPINGTRRITMTLYDASSGGNALCTDTDNVAAVNGLFNAYMDYCTAEDLNGRQVWLGIKVGGDAEMTPRQRIYAVPYAWSLRPGAVISETLNGAILHIENWYTTGRGLRAYAMSQTGINYGVVGASRSPDGYGGHFYNNGGGIGLQGYSTGAGLAGAGVLAEARGASGVALHAKATSTDASVVIGNAGTGALLKGFGADGGNDEFRINNNGSIETKADSYIFIPGQQIFQSADYDLLPVSNGAVRIWARKVSNDDVIVYHEVHLPITLPAVLYGQPVDIESITVYYKCQDGTKNYISSTQLRKQTDADSYMQLVSDETDRKSTTATSYTLPVNNVLSANQGVLGLHFHLDFNDVVNYIQLGGVRIQLGHHHLY